MILLSKIIVTNELFSCNDFLPAVTTLNSIIHVNIMTVNSIVNVMILNSILHVNVMTLNTSSIKLVKTLIV